jgi:hypothetical protein
VGTGARIENSNNKKLDAFENNEALEFCFFLEKLHIWLIPEKLDNLK